MIKLFGLHFGPAKLEAAIRLVVLQRPQAGDHQLVVPHLKHGLKVNAAVQTVKAVYGGKEQDIGKLRRLLPLSLKK